MKQLTQKLKDGATTVQEVPVPQVASGMILVQNHYSLISAGTEGSTAKTARKSLIGKAKERPQQVKQVIDVLKKQGPVQTYRAITKKLEAYSPCGYSSAGVVLEVGDGVAGFKPGDKVACAGAGYASHAEIVSVPVNLCVKLPEDGNLELASYNTLGAIALQGIRQADMRLGETCAVIGLGLLGHLTCLLLKASGVKVVGIDVSASAVAAAKEHCADLALERSAPGINETILEYTHGHGVDAVIITAGTSSLDPINFAGEIARKKGKVVVVGAVPTGFDRDPDYYPKELELKMSCSYGPGRYDLDYEEKGLDYPYAYVRWTENRNMQAFQELLASGTLDIGYLSTHRFKLEDSPQAYEMIVNRSEPFLGIVIEYDTDKKFVRNKIPVNKALAPGKVNIAFIGAGSYAQGNLLPNIPANDPEVVCKGVMTNSGTTSKRVAERFKFEFCASDEKDIIGNQEINTLFVATRHDSHADYVVKGLAAGKNVFVEKPLAMNADDLERIKELMTADNPHRLMVGFNRRFAPFAIKLKQALGAGPKSMIYRINAGAIPGSSWIQDMKLGGGRIVGEACHFIDFMTFMCDSLPVRVYAAAVPDPNGFNDTVNISLEFANGSIGSVAYYANGSKAISKEYFEVYRAGTTGIIKDFRELEIYGKSKKRMKNISQDKGQAEMVRNFIGAIKEGKSSPIPFADIYAVSLAALKTIESLESQKALVVR